MRDHANLLHNMSSPPSSVIKYGGLSGLLKGDGSEGGLKPAHPDAFGCFVAFRLPTGMPVRSPAMILDYLGEQKGQDAKETLLKLVERRAAELPLPDACLVKTCEHSHPNPWPDPLAAMAIITKSSANIWLRTKAPSLYALARRNSVSLLLPRSFAVHLKELSP